MATYQPHCEERGPSVISDACIAHYQQNKETKSIHNPQQDIVKKYKAKVQKMLENTTNNFQYTPQSRNLLYIFIIHAPNDLGLMDIWLSDQSPIYDSPDRHHYIIVPDQRLYQNHPELARSYFNRWNTVKNVYVVEEELSILGSWGGSSLVYKEIIGYLKAFELGLDFSHAVLDSATALPLKTVDEMMGIYKPETSYVSIWDSDHHTGNKIDRTKNLFLDCGGCIYKLAEKTDKEVYSRTAPPVLDEWQTGVRNGTFNNDGSTNPLAKGAQWKALTKELIYESLIGSKKNLFSQYFEFFETVWIPDEFFWPTYITHEFINKESNTFEIETKEHVKSLWVSNVVGELTVPYFKKKVKKENQGIFHRFFGRESLETRGDFLRKDNETTMFRKVININETKAIVKLLFGNFSRSSKTTTTTTTTTTPSSSSSSSSSSSPLFTTTAAPSQSAAITPNLAATTTKPSDGSWLSSNF
eukprot:Pgem_evm1s19362